MGLGRLGQSVRVRQGTLNFGVIVLYRHDKMVLQPAWWLQPMIMTGFSLTEASAGNYSFDMLETKIPSAVDQELKRLERRIDELLATVEHLKEENRALRQRQEMLAAEKTSLLSRNEQVRTRVEAMIGRLKAMEHTA
jgi:cell division protein ZapB